MVESIAGPRHALAASLTDEFVDVSLRLDQDQASAPVGKNSGGGQVPVGAACHRPINGEPPSAEMLADVARQQRLAQAVQERLRRVIISRGSPMAVMLDMDTCWW